MLNAVGVLFLARELAVLAGVIGLLFAAGGAGGVFGAVTASWWTRRFGQGRVVLGALLVTGPLMLFIPLSGPGPLLTCYAVGLFAYSYGGVLYNVAQVSFRRPEAWAW